MQRVPELRNPLDLALEDANALLLYSQGRVEQALDRLGERTDPDATRVRLIVLLNAERLSEAAELIRHAEPHPRWADLGIRALTMCGDFEAARKYVQWSQDRKESHLWHACLIAFARSRFLRAVSALPQEKQYTPGALGPGLLSEFREALVDLRPLLSSIQAAMRIRSGVEADAVALGTELHFWLGELQEYAALASILIQWSPIPLAFAFAVVRGAIKPSYEFVDRLRKERGESFEFALLAALIQGKGLGQVNEAVSALERLAEKYSEGSERDRIGRLMLSLAHELTAERADSARRSAIEILGKTSRFAQLYKGETYLNDENIGEAKRLVESHRDTSDPYWLQLAGAVKEREGALVEALEYMERAADISGDPEVARQAGFLALRMGERSRAIRLFERVLHEIPRDVSAVGQMALLRSEAGDHESAATLFGLLSEIEPDVGAHGINQALALTRAGHLERSLDLFRKLCSSGEATPVEAVLGRAGVLKRLDRLKEAFESLIPFRKTYWGNPRFVQAYTELGFASSRDLEAESGVEQLKLLHDKGMDEGLLTVVPISDLIERMRRASEADEKLHELMIQGQVPWVLTAGANNLTIIEEWDRRTGERDSNVGEPISRARSSLYASNAFTRTVVDGNSAVVLLRASDEERPVVIDITALHTLTRLNLMEEATTFFGRCLIPKEYLDLETEERDRLQIFQPSIEEAYRRIHKAIERGALNTLESVEGLPLLADAPADQATIRPLGSVSLHSLRGALLEDSRLTAEQLNRFDLLAGSLAQSPLPRVELSRNTTISIGMQTLHELARRELLQEILDSFRVIISECDSIWVARKVAEFDKRRARRENHVAMWDRLRTEIRLEFVSSTIPELAIDRDGDRAIPDSNTLLPWYSAFVSIERGLPLLADDRALQSYVLEQSPGNTSSFGTAQLLLAMCEREIITDGALAGGFEKLIEWRYRFLLVPPRALFVMAKRHRHSPPGAALQATARYLHDSLRDDGLPADFPPNSPMQAYGYSYFKEWIAGISELIKLVWADSSFSDGAAGSLTEWAVAEFLPSPPRSMGTVAVVASNLLPVALLSDAFVRFVSIADQRRAHTALTIIAKACGISPIEYARMLAEVVNAI